MKCCKCGEELTKTDICIEVVDHGEELLDIIIECPECSHRINNFVPVRDFIDID